MKFLIGLSLVLAAAAQADNPNVLTKDITDNRTVKLISAKRSEVRGQNLVARFLEVGKEQGPEIVVKFPAHSHTTRETSLMNIIGSCVDWQRDRGANDWNAAKFEATFSIPRDAKGYVTHFERWYFIAFGPPRAK